MKNEKIGLTGEFPKGKINSGDLGSIRIAIGIDREKNVVFIEFGTEVAWLAFGREEALALAETILSKAELLDGEKK